MFRYYSYVIQVFSTNFPDNEMQMDLPTAIAFELFQQIQSSVTPSILERKFNSSFSKSCVHKSRRMSVKEKLHGAK